MYSDQWTFASLVSAPSFASRHDNAPRARSPRGICAAFARWRYSVLATSMISLPCRSSAFETFILTGPSISAPAIALTRAW